MAHITLTDIRKSFGAFQVIKGVDMEIRSGEFMVFVGPSGCGKSTLLRLIAGLEGVSAGTLTFDGEVMNQLAPAKRGIAMVFQSYALYPHMTVFNNMAFGMKLAGQDKTERDRRVREAAEMLQLTPYLERLPRSVLSWLKLVATGLSPFSGQAIHFLHYAPEDLPYAKNRYRKEVERTYEVLDKRLDAAPWLAGDEYTIADMALWGWAAFAGYVFGENGLEEFPAVQRFMTTMSERSAVQSALALKAAYTFKSVLDDETRKALFPQNAGH